MNNILQKIIKFELTPLVSKDEFIYERMNEFFADNFSIIESKVEDYYKETDPDKYEEIDFDTDRYDEEYLDAFYNNAHDEYKALYEFLTTQLKNDTKDYLPEMIEDFLSSGISGLEFVSSDIGEIVVNIDLDNEDLNAEYAIDDDFANEIENDINTLVEDVLNTYIMEEDIFRYIDNNIEETNLLYGTNIIYNTKIDIDYLPNDFMVSYSISIED